jgi:MFS family permease
MPISSAKASDSSRDARREECDLDPQRMTRRGSPLGVSVAPLASFVALGVSWGAWAALVPEIQRQTAASEPELGAALLWVGGGALPAMLLTGRLWRRFGRRLVTGALLLYAAVAVLPALAPDPVFLAVSLALVGAASGSLDVAMNAAVSEIEASTGRRLMYIAHGLFSLAVLVASVTVGILRGTGVGPFPVLATVALAFLALAALAAAGDRATSDPRPNIAVTAAPDTPAGVPRIPAGVLTLGLLCAVAFLIEDAMVSWSAIHLEDSLGASPALGGAGPGIFSAAMFVGRWAGQPLGKRFGEREILVGCGVVAAAGSVVVSVAPTAILALAGFALTGAGISVAAPALFGRAGRLAGPMSRGAAVSMLTTFGYMGFVVGPPFVGFVAGATDLRVAFAGLAVMALGLGGVAWLAVRDRPADPADSAVRHALDASEPPVLRG